MVKSRHYSAGNQFDESQNSYENNEFETIYRNANNMIVREKVIWNTAMPTTDYLSYCPQIQEPATTYKTEYARAFTWPNVQKDESSAQPIRRYAEKADQIEWRAKLREFKEWPSMFR